MLDGLLRYDKKLLRIAATAVVGLAALGLVACGGDDADEAGSATMPGSSGGMLAGATRDGSASGFAGGGFDVATEERAAFGEAGAPPTGAQQSSGANSSVAGVLGRQVIRNGSMDLSVESVGDAFEQVRGVAEQAGGFVASSTFSGRQESQRARMTLRIPSDKFDQVIADLRNLAVEVDNVSTGSQDVTEEFSDLEAAMRNLRAVEQQYLTLLGEARDIGEILQVQDRLNGVRYEIERIQGRLNVLENQTSLATLEVALYPEAASAVKPASTGFVTRVQEAWESSLEFLATVGTGIVVAVVWSWWLIPLLIVALLVLRRLVAQALARRDGEGDPGRLDRVDTPEGAA